MMIAATAMREAFERAVAPVMNHNRLTATVHNMVNNPNKGPGLHKTDWNARLSFKTAQKLKAPTFDQTDNPHFHPGKVRMPYDAMCEGRGEE